MGGTESRKNRIFDFSSVRSKSIHRMNTKSTMFKTPLWVFMREIKFFLLLCFKIAIIEFDSMIQPSRQKLCFSQPFRDSLVVFSVFTGYNMHLHMQTGKK